MADYREIARRHPAVRDYLRHRKWVRRGDVMAYAPDIDTPSFSTDVFGFRHSVLDGARFGMAAAFDGQPYALAMGASHVFGFGLGSNADTIPSRLSARTGVRCINISFPEIGLRAVHSVAARVIAEAERPPEFLCLFVGGVLSRYCFTRRCDPLFGSPDFAAPEDPLEPGGAAEDLAYRNLVTYTKFWMGQHLALARACGAKLIAPLDSTVFEKSRLTAEEESCRLGQGADAAAEARFRAFRMRQKDFQAHTESWMERNGLLARTDPDAMTFIDEFHYDAASADRVACALADRLERAWT